MSIRSGTTCFNKRSRGLPGIPRGGFTLLEVMIAVSLLAITLVTLIGAQSQSVAIATGSKFDVMAALLAQRRLGEICLQEYEAVTGGEGDFGEAYPQFRWKVEVTELGEQETGFKEMPGMLKAVDLTVSIEGDQKLSYGLRTILLREDKVAR